MLLSSEAVGAISGRGPSAVTNLPKVRSPVSIGICHGHSNDREGVGPVTKGVLLDFQ